jgi:hypothetical protein
MSTQGMDQSLKVGRGYLDEQAFLQRSDAKQDEMRRDVRRKEIEARLAEAPQPKT